MTPISLQYYMTPWNEVENKTMWITSIIRTWRGIVVWLALSIFFLTPGNATEVECGDVVNIDIPQDQQWGTFETPGYYSDGLPTDRNCGWLITNPDGLNVAVLLYEMYLPTYQSGAVEIRKDASDPGEIVASAFQGEDFTSEIATNPGQIYIEYSAGNNASARGFKALFAVEEVSQEDWSYDGCLSPASIPLQANQVKYLTTEDFPSNYEDSSSCKWVITADSVNKIINFRIRWLSIRMPNNICQDVVNIYDADNADDEATLKYEPCGERLIDSLIGFSTGQDITVTFTSNSLETRSGFFMELWSQIATVDNIVTVPEEQKLNSFESPGYSAGNIPAEQSLGWKIVNPNSGLKVYVLIYDVEMAQSQSAFAKVYKGSDIANVNNELSPIIQGESYNSDIYTSDTGEAYIYYNSGYNPSGRGFKVYYVIEVPNQPDYSHGGCSSAASLTANTSDQYITSPNFPEAYTANSNCKWTIDSGGKFKRIQLKVQWLYLDSPEGGCSDLLKIYDSDSSSGTPVLEPCGQKKMSAYQVTSTGRYLTITFTTNGQIEQSGFAALFTISSGNGPHAWYTLIITLVYVLVKSAYY